MRAGLDSHQQRLCFSDLRHFRRWREAFQRQRKSGVGVGATVDQLIEFGERKRRAQFEAPRALVLGDGDSGLKGFLRRRKVVGIALYQSFSADAMQFRFEGAMTGPLARCQRFVETRDGAVGIACPGFGSGEGNLEESVEGQDVLLAQKFDPATHVRERLARPPAFSRRHAHENEPEGLPHRQIMLTRDSREFGGV
jgi:hypothetical protein